jgi:hypothetical protein
LELEAEIEIENGQVNRQERKKNNKEKKIKSDSK